MPEPHLLGDGRLVLWGSAQFALKLPKLASSLVCRGTIVPNGRAIKLKSALRHSKIQFLITEYSV